MEGNNGVFLLPLCNISVQKQSMLDDDIEANKKVGPNLSRLGKGKYE